MTASGASRTESAAESVPTPPGHPSVVARLAAAGALIGFVFLLGAIVSDPRNPGSADSAWLATMVDLRGPVLDVPALVLNLIGAGVVGAVIIPILVTVTLLLWRRRWAAVYFAIAALVDPFIVGAMKQFFGRDRPLEALLDVESASYPSGHASRAALIAVTFAVVFRRAWIYAAGAAYAVFMALSRTYLGVHWLSDTIGGLVFGAVIGLLLYLPFAGRIRAEASHSHPPPWRRLWWPKAR